MRKFDYSFLNETQEAMEQLEFAYLAARDDAGINQLLLIPCVILDFLCIHPFRDGNGRMSRLLSFCCSIKTDMTLAGMYPLRNKLTTIRHIIMRR